MKLKSFWLRMVPVLILVAVTVFMSVDVYFQMIRAEEEVCWNRLEVATNSTAGKIQTRITDNLNYLTTVAEAYTLTQQIADLNAVGAYISAVEEKTIFERIDVILPDESLITQSGEIATRQGSSTFDELVGRGTHITGRLTSSFTGKESICAVTPIRKGEKVLGLLVGTISCDTLSEIFEVFTYGQEAQLFLIDRTDGNYLMDNWHEELGNIHDLGLREDVTTGEMVDMTPIILAGERARFVFISQSNGEKSYQYCAPVEGFHWEVCVVVQENVVFANVKALESKLLNVGLVELLVVLVYVLWNVALNSMAVRSENKVKRLEYEKARNEARATFLSNMSHDIKTPLNGIVGMLQIIRNHRQEEDKVDDCLQKIEISAQYLSTLASDMLDISEIENDKLVLAEEPIDLNRLMGDMASMMEKQAQDAGVRCTVDVGKLSNAHILGSAVHIKRILANLIGNAIKYSKGAGKRVWVSVWDELENDENRRMYHFVIRDNGIGMSEEFQQHMYRAFEQEMIDARSEYQGYGLGLTIVHHLIRKMGGTIHLDSEKGKGSTFTVSIPFRLDEGVAAWEENQPEAQDMTGLRLLLVEDNAFNMEIAQVLLTDAGARVDTATDGQQAVKAFEAAATGTYDAILMDVMMPVMDGCEATMAIRKLPRPDAKEVPIIAMTASTFAEDIARCLAAGMNAHLPKPLDAQEMLRTIWKHTKGGKK